MKRKCKCGCGKEPKESDYCRRHNPSSGFQKGHKSYINEDIIIKLRIKSEENWRNEEVRKKRIEGIKKSQDIRKNKMKIIMTKWWNENKNTEKGLKMIEKLDRDKKDKTYEEIYGNEKSEDIKIKISNSCKGRVFSEMSRKKLRESAIKRVERQKFNGLPLIPCIGKNELQFLNILENNLGYKILRQYSVEGYFLDGYIPELNLAIEVDEDYHKKQIEKDIKRENIIKDKLNCEFIRI